MPRTVPSLWLALTMGALAVGCSKDSAGPLTDTTIAPDRGREGEGKDDDAVTYAVIGDVPYTDAKLNGGAVPPDPDCRDQPGRRRPAGHPYRRLQGWQRALHRRLFPGHRHSVRDLHRSARLHPRRQRVDRLPPRQQRRLQSARSARPGPGTVLPEPRLHPRRQDAGQGPEGLPGEPAMGGGRRPVRRAPHPRFEQRPRPVVWRPRPRPTPARRPRKRIRANGSTAPGTPRISGGSRRPSRRPRKSIPPASSCSSRPTCGTRTTGPPDATPIDYLRLTIDPKATGVFSWTQVNVP